MAVSIVGERQRPPSVWFLHGFAQTGACIGPIDAELRTWGILLAPDLIGTEGGPAGLGDAASDLWELGRLVAEAVRPGDILVGYSFGARVAAHAAILADDRLAGLVLIGVHPGIASADERRQRQAADRGLADDIRRDGTEAFVERWLDLDLFAGLPPWARFAELRSKLSPTALAHALERFGTGTQDDLADALHRITCATLLITGAHDARFSAIAEHLVSNWPNATWVSVPGVGHAAHLEAPEETAAVLHQWRADLLSS